MNDMNEMNHMNHMDPMDETNELNEPGDANVISQMEKSHVLSEPQQLEPLDAVVATRQGQIASALAAFSQTLLPLLAEMADDGSLNTEAEPNELAELEVFLLAAEDGDLSVVFDDVPLGLMRSLINQPDLAPWGRVRIRLKKAGVRMAELEKQLRAGNTDNNVNTNGNANRNGREDAAADRLIALARSCCTFFHDEQRQFYASFESGGARQVYPLDSRGFQGFLAHRFHTEFDRSPSEQALRNAMVTLSGDAEFEGEEHSTYLRIAKTEDGYWLDLCDAQWQCVRITAAGWQVMSGEGTPLFTRTASMQPLPLPLSGASLDDLWKLINIPDEDRILVLAWLLECLRPETPHVVLELVGEQGSAKSSAQRILRRLIDPNQADLRPAPKTLEDVWVAARNSHVVSLENLSHMSPALQDALCTLCTGGGYATRKLYTNSEETVINLRRPVVLNGIAVIVTAQDLLDRSIHIGLPRIEQRALASEVETSFQERQPYLLGALLDLMVKTLQTLPQVEISPDKRPRMADFALLGEAVCRALGGKPGEYAQKYAGVRKEGVLRTMDASPVGVALLALFEKMGGRREKFHGTMAELLLLLDPHKSEDRRDWPRTPKAMGDALRRLAPALRVLGYECVDEEKRGGVRRWRIALMPELLDTCPQSPVSPQALGSPPSPALTFAPPDVSAGHSGHAGHGLESSTPQKEKHLAADDDAEEF